MPRLSHPASVLAIGSIVLLLTACSPEQWGFWTGRGDATTPTPAATSTSDGSASGASAPDQANGCPIGSWVLDNASWESALEAIWAAAAPGSDVAVSGSLELDWDDAGGYLLTARSSQYVVTGVADGVDFVQTVRHEGTESGAWNGSGADYHLVAEGATGMSSTVTLSAAGGDQVYDQNDVAADPWSGSMVVACTATGMTTTVSEASGSLTVSWLRR